MSFGWPVWTVTAPDCASEMGQLGPPLHNDDSHVTNVNMVGILCWNFEVGEWHWRKFADNLWQEIISNYSKLLEVPM